MPRIGKKLNKKTVGFIRMRMKTLMILMLSATLAIAGITLPETLDIDGSKYTEVAYQSHDAAQIKFAHSDGIATIDITKFSKEIQDQCGYDPAAAAEMKNADAAKRAENAKKTGGKRKGHREEEGGCASHR